MYLCFHNLNNMELAIFGFLLLAGGFLVLKNNQRLITFLVLLLMISSTFLLVSILSPEESASSFLGVIGNVLAASFILGTVIKNKWLKIILPFVLIVLLMFLGDSALAFGNYTLDLSLPKIIALPILGAVLMSILDVKAYYIVKLFPEINLKTAERSIVFIVVGLFSIIATFLASWFGFYLLAVGAFIYGVFSLTKRDYIPVSLLTISVVAFFMSTFEIDTIDLSIGKVMAGFFIGSGVVGLIALVQQLKNKVIAILFMLASAGLLVLVLLLNGVHPAYGGIETFIAAVLGVAVAGIYFQNNYIGSFLLPMIIIIGLTLPSDPFENSGIDNVNAMTGTQTEKGNNEKSIVGSQKGLPLEEIQGNYSIEESTSVISFQLGPKGGITKGEIKGFKGKINLTPAIENSTFNITIPVIKLSTFNSMRDESLMEDLYFDEPKFPTMSFASTSLEAKEDGYLLNGKFTMLGKTNEQQVYIKHVGEKDGKQILVGEASIDKTKFGMEPSPQEGDVVDFTFQILLIP